MLSVSRRRFLAAGMTSAVLTATASGRKPGGEPPICVFSKHLQHLGYGEMAKACKGLGLDGIDLTVRKGGHVAPENVATDLPRAVDAIRSEGLEVPMISTALCNGRDPDARPILEAASAVAIPYFRIGGQRYRENGAPLDDLARFTEEVRSLTELAEEYGITAGYHNHSGPNNVGAPLWDLHRMFEAVGSSHLGSNFDVGHAFVEGGFGAWEINARLLRTYVKMMAVKDFVWGDRTPQWVPLGQGRVPLAGFFRIFRETGFTGPISIHFEDRHYAEASAKGKLEEIGCAVETLREQWGQ
jgi:L-ribulose-5-phosphate 3-epimerase